MKSRIIFFICAFVLCSTVFAHKMKVFASREGKVITGYVYFSGGGRPKHLKVEVLGSDGKTVAVIYTGPKGRFMYGLKKNDDFTFVANSGDGHKAAYTVKALAPVSSPSEKKSEESPEVESVNSSQLRKVVGEEVSRQLAPLREQLEGYEEKIRFRDVLGGIGFIFGIAGIYFYLLARKKK